MIEGVYVGGLTSLPPEGHSTGIYKLPVAGAVQVGKLGLAGDVQADRRVHGGPEKAVHHYAAENLARLATAFPSVAAQLVPGGIGENLSTHGWHEENVCIGDLFRLGTAVVQVSQPRSPCWKIDHKFAVQGMARFVGEQGIAGWYYRVVEEGEVAVGAAFDLLERPAPAVSVARLWRVTQAHRPAEDELVLMQATPGLAPNWVQKLAERREWLRRNGVAG